MRHPCQLELPVDYQRISRQYQPLPREESIGEAVLERDGLPRAGECTTLDVLADELNMAINEGTERATGMGAADDGLVGELAALKDRHAVAR